MDYGTGGGPTSGNPYDIAYWAFNESWNLGTQKSAQADALFNSAVNLEGGPASMTPARLNFTPNAPAPAVHIPFMAEGASVAKFQELSTAVINQLAGLYSGYMDQYFPDQASYLLRAQEWIENTIVNGGTGINAHVERQIWERDRSRVLGESRRLEQEAIQSWAAKGYPLPPGAAAHQITMIRADADAKISQASRDVAIKQAEIEVENVRFAVEQALKLYSAASAAAGDYLKALSIGPSAGMQIVPSITDSQSKLIAAATDYWRANISVEELRLKSTMPSAEWDQASRVKNGEWVMEQIKNRVAAAVEAAKSVGTQAAAALNSLHVAASVSGNTSNSVGYQYSNDTASAAPTVTQI